MIGAASAILLIALLWRVARQRARTYALHLSVLEARSLAFFCAAPIVGELTTHQSPGWSGVVATALATVCAATDMQTGYVFDRVLLATVPFAAVAVWADGTVGGALRASALAALLFGTLYVASRGRGIGLGDVKLAALLAACLGMQGALRSFVCAFVVGAAYGCLLLLRGATRRREVRFAPFLTLGSMFALVEGFR